MSTTLAQDAVNLRAAHLAVIRAQYETQARLHEFNAEEMRLYAKHCVPPGCKIDVFGDGKIKPEAECASLPREGAT